VGALRAYWAERHFNVERLEDLHRAVRVGGRYLALPLEAYPRLRSFAEANAAWERVGAEIGEAALRDGLGRAGLRPRDVDHLFFVTVTGITTPSLDARLCNRLGLRADVRRSPLFGLGCVAGAAGLARACDVLRAFPEQVAVLLSVELCSLTLQREDLSIANIVASGLFGDGAAAVVLVGGERDGKGHVHGYAHAHAHGYEDEGVHEDVNVYEDEYEHAGRARGPRVVATRSVFYPDTLDVMGWDIVDTGFKVVLSARVPAVIRDHIGGDVDAFLAEHGLGRSDIRHWVAHTGGPKVLEAVAEALALPRGALERSWHSLAQIGNLSSASVLFVLGELMDADVARPGDWGLLLAMGPGLCSEMVLLRW
jgi:alkylresorcinol/alkylpyrone synthase